MRQLADRNRIHSFMQALGKESDSEACVYLSGGATAVWLGWRSTTIDVDIKIVPERDALLRTIPRLKELLQLNVELASPDLFIPALKGWEERSQWIGREGKISFYHYDFYSQILAKIERSHKQDLEDIEAMFQRKLAKPEKVLEYYEQLEPEIYRFPALDRKSLRQKVQETVQRYQTL